MFLTNIDFSQVVIISDREKGLKSSLNDVLPESGSGMCNNHLKENLRKVAKDEKTILEICIQ